MDWLSRGTSVSIAFLCFSQVDAVTSVTVYHDDNEADERQDE